MNGVKLHTCADGHIWREHPDGTVGPSWGYGGTKCAFPGHDPMTCPEPARVWHRINYAYLCPTCGTLTYAGHCHGPDGTNWARSTCQPPPPACLKRAVSTRLWTPPSKARPLGDNPWMPVELETADHQLELAVGV